MIMCVQVLHLLEFPTVIFTLTISDDDRTCMCTVTRLVNDLVSTFTLFVC